MYKLPKSVTKINSKVQEPKTCKKEINDPIYGIRWCETVVEELWNLDTQQT